MCAHVCVCVYVHAQFVWHTMSYVSVMRSEECLRRQIYSVFYFVFLLKYLNYFRQLVWSVYTVTSGSIYMNRRRLPVAPCWFGGEKESVLQFACPSFCQKEEGWRGGGVEGWRGGGVGAYAVSVWEETGKGLAQVAYGFGLHLVLAKAGSRRWGFWNVEGIGKRLGLAIKRGKRQ